MSAEAVEHPCDGEPETPLQTAHKLMEQNPGLRVEIIGGVITVTPSADIPHSRVLTGLMIPFLAAGLHGGETEVHQAISVWLPSGPVDYVIPDLAIVDADVDDHLIDDGGADPECFRLVLEVTSSNYNNDLRNKVVAYADAKIPVYVIVDRKHGRIHVLTEPGSGEYTSHRVYAPGQQVTLPDSIGAKVTLDVAEILKAGSRRQTPEA
ncbi:Uma2 family endonuclease [Streptomyces sp. NPDC058657]|uniref:Uma2 family endonuclease n=1 Tax=unclassified Streptomyces TaxID=2593676 RepID=UPI003669FDE5